MPIDRREEVQKQFLKNYSLLRGFVCGLVPDLQQAEDILQDVFVEVTRKSGDFQPGTDFPAWARAFARNKVYEFWRKSRRRHLLLCPEALDAVVRDAEVLDDTWAARRKALAECIEEVAPKARQILKLRYRQGVAPADIARRLSWTVAAVYTALSKVRKFLRDCTGRRLASEEIPTS